MVNFNVRRKRKKRRRREKKGEEKKEGREGTSGDVSGGEPNGSTNRGGLRSLLYMEMAACFWDWKGRRID